MFGSPSKAAGMKPSRRSSISRFAFLYLPNFTERDWRSWHQQHISTHEKRKAGPVIRVALRGSLQ
jgi:hypothetical protein